MYAINHALFLLAFSPPSRLLLHSTPRSSCHELFAGPLQRPHSTLCYFILTHCKSRPFCLYPNTSCHDATPSTPLHLQVWGKTHSAAPFTHPTHVRIIFYALLPYCFIPVPFLCYISASSSPKHTFIKCDQFFSHPPACQYTLPTLLGLLAPIPVFFCFFLPSPESTIF